MKTGPKPRQIYDQQYHSWTKLGVGMTDEIKQQHFTDWKQEGKPQFPMGALETYQKAAEWLDGHGTVFDWGCGTAYAARYFTKSKYVGVDGESRFADLNVDLLDWRGGVDSILLRHVLEHDRSWVAILMRAVESFRKRMVLVSFVPWNDGECSINTRTDDFVPYLSLPKKVAMEIIGAYLVKTEDVPAPGGRTETLYYLEKK